MEVPNSITVNTGEQEKIHRKIDKFFKDITSRLEPLPLKKPSQVKLKVLNLCRLEPTPLASDDYAHILFYKEKVVATVFETRTSSNHIHYDFFKHL